MAQTPLPPPNPSGRVGSRSADEQALLEARLARLAARSAAHPSKSGAASGGGQPTRTSPGRRHPAARARMAAVGLSVASTAGLVALFATGKAAGAGTTSAGSAAVVRTSSVAGSSGTLAPTATSSPSSSPAAASQSGSSQATNASQRTAPATAAPTTQAARPASSVVDGAVESNRWGNVQVEVTFDASGQLTDVVALQTPNDRGRSIEINNYAVPALTSEALSAQSASIDSVSGATYTSNSYAQSLQSAIDAARAAGITNIA